MVEIKYFKNIPAKIINKNTSILSIKDAYLYADKNNNRFCFVEFNNLSSNPLFSLMLHIKQYDLNGQFLKEGKFYISDCYHPHGIFEIDEPFAVDKECDAIEVYVQRAEFLTRGFYNDSLCALKDMPRAFGSRESATIPETGLFRHEQIANQQAPQANNAANNVQNAAQNSANPQAQAATNATIPTNSVGSYKTIFKWNWIAVLGCVLLLIVIFFIVHGFVNGAFSKLGLRG